MNISRRISAALLAGALSLSLAGAAFAQAGRGGGSRLQTVPAAIVTRLNLNDEQKAKFQAAADAYKTENTAAQALSTPKEKRAASKAAREKYDAAVRAALNADQTKQLDAFLAEAKEYQALGTMGSQMVGLNLTAEQKTKIQEIGTKYQPELKKLRDSQKDATDKQAVMAQIREQQGKMMAEVREVLTPEQRKQLPGRKKQQ
jgi:Spy/CpxP family protein refolding chaperone